MNINNFDGKIFDLKNNDDVMFEFTAFEPSELGLPTRIYIRTVANKDIDKYPVPMLWFQNNYRPKFSSVNDLVPISIENTPKIFIGTNINISAPKLELLKKWIVDNKLALIRHFSGKTDSVGLLKELRHADGNILHK